jgi:endonuclease/exonuclease/phosphatase family metal-dependent hydrolase
MRLISWNVCDGFTRKFGHLERLKPDIAILQEVRPACLRYASLADRAVWVGDEGQKGLVAISYGDWFLTRSPIQVDERWFVPLVARNGNLTLHVIAVWVDSTKECGPPTLRAIQQLREFILAAPTIVAGDFNHCVAMDPRKSQGRRFSMILHALGNLGLSSAWHGFHNEDHGAESAATLYWTWNAERRFHIDFVFHSRTLQVSRAELGNFNTYVQARISDHVPLTVDFSI